MPIQKSSSPILSIVQVTSDKVPLVLRVDGRNIEASLLDMVVESQESKLFFHLGILAAFFNHNRFLVF